MLQIALLSMQNEHTYSQLLCHVISQTAEKLLRKFFDSDFVRKYTIFCSWCLIDLLAHIGVFVYLFFEKVVSMNILNGYNFSKFFA